MHCRRVELRRNARAWRAGWRYRQRAVPRVRLVRPWGQQQRPPGGRRALHRQLRTRLRDCSLPSGTGATGRCAAAADWPRSAPYRAPRADTAPAGPDRGAGHWASRLGRHRATAGEEDRPGRRRRGVRQASQRCTHEEGERRRPAALEARCTERCMERQRAAEGRRTGVDSGKGRPQVAQRTGKRLLQA